MKKNKSVFVIILNWNKRDLLLDCLDSVIKSITSYNINIIVVDNHSTDDSIQKVKENYPNAKLIVNSKNEGWSGGNNKGIRYALKNNADYIVLLNNDIVLDKNCLQRMILKLEKDSSVDILGPKIYKFPKSKRTISNAGNYYNRHYFGILVGAGEKDAGRYNKDKELDFVAGVVCARSNVYKKTGLFDEKYFLYFEDADFCERAKRKGFRCAYIHNAVQYHWESATNTINSPLFTYYNTRNHLLFVKKHFKKSLIKEIIYTSKLIIHDMRNGNDNWYYELRGSLDFIFNRFYQRKYWN